MIYASEQLPSSPSSWKRHGPWLFSFRFVSGEREKETFFLNCSFQVIRHQQLRTIKQRLYTPSLRWEQHPLRNCWDIVSWIDFWKKTIIYTILAVILFAQPHRAWFSIVGGLMLIALALLHSARWYHAIKNTPMSLLEQHDDGYKEAHMFSILVFKYKKFQI